MPTIWNFSSQNPYNTKAMCPRGQKSCFGAKNDDALRETKVFATRQKLTWFLMKLDMHYWFLYKTQNGTAQCDGLVYKSSGKYTLKS